MIPVALPIATRRCREGRVKARTCGDDGKHCYNQTLGVRPVNEGAPQCRYHAKTRTASCLLAPIGRGRDRHLAEALLRSSVESARSRWHWGSVRRWPATQGSPWPTLTGPARLAPPRPRPRRTTPRRGRTRPRERCPPGRRVTAPSPRLAPTGPPRPIPRMARRRTPTPRTPTPRTPTPTTPAPTSRKTDRGRPEVTRNHRDHCADRVGVRRPRGVGPEACQAERAPLGGSRGQGPRRSRRRPAGGDPSRGGRCRAVGHTIRPEGTNRVGRPSRAGISKPRNRIRNRPPCWRRSTPCPPARTRPRPPPSQDRSAWSRGW